ncbi:MAG: PA0069 family radical SAM protein [Gammaproteobacteria bacterium]|nr:PA0069 family radical SAM protein [Gammaproteobacteria bacterium]
MTKPIRDTFPQPGHNIRGRGARGNLPGRFERQTYEPDPGVAELAPHPDTELIPELSKSIISRNKSPDVGFEQSITPYKGCEHGCIYCYARPSHAYLDFSPGLDFETKIVHKPNAAELLKRELARPGYKCKSIALGVNTDCYQPFEKQLGTTRALLEIMLETRHPVGIVTKSALVERDLDLLSELARLGLTHVFLSITTLDNELKRRMEPRTASPRRRLATIERLTEAGVPAGVMFAPVIPALNDHELEAILEASAKAGALWAGYTVLRLPNEVRPLFKDWLAEQYPLRAKHVMSRVRQIRGGRENDSSFGRRMRGQGHYADLLRQRFDRACRRHGLNAARRPSLRTTLFRPPAVPPKPPHRSRRNTAPEEQLSLLP